MNSAVPNIFKYRQNAPFSVFFFLFSLQFQIVSNAVRMHHLASLFFSLCYYKSFQIPPECTLYLVLDLSLKFQIGISNSVYLMPPFFPRSAPVNYSWHRCERWNAFVLIVSESFSNSRNIRRVVVTVATIIGSLYNDMYNNVTQRQCV